LVKGDNVYKYSPQRMVRFQQETIGIIYQAFNLIPSLTVLDNVTLPLIFAGISAAERDRRGMILLKRFGVEKQAHKVATTLSGGQMQRIAVSRALVNNPEILLADEPVGNLDSVSADEVMNTLEEINMKDKKTVILVTHDARYLPYAHRIYFLKDGGVEREVINPEKKQVKSVKPGTTILTEIEKLSRIYPYVTIDDLKVKSILNYLTQDIGFDQLERVEKYVVEFLEGKLEDFEFVHKLTAPYTEGGAELPVERATKVVSRIENIMNQARVIRQYRKRLQEKFTSPRQKDRLEGVRQAVLDDFGKPVSDEQVVWLDAHIASRIAGLITMEDFRDRLTLPREHEGGGFTANDSRAISRFLEKLIAQGVHL
jgi:putative ABC transport system ATP-binding protein